MWGNVLKSRREELKLTQAELGKVIGVSAYTVASAEKSQANVSFATVADLAAVLSLDIKALADSQVISSEIKAASAVIARLDALRQSYEATKAELAETEQKIRTMGSEHLAGAVERALAPGDGEVEGDEIEIEPISIDVPDLGAGGEHESALI